MLHGVVITLSFAGPYTLIHLYSILCRFPSHTNTRTHTQIDNIEADGSLDGLAERRTAFAHAHTPKHTNAQAQRSCWQALPRQINLVYSLIWAQIAPPQAHTYTHKNTHKYNITNNISTGRSNELETCEHTHTHTHTHRPTALNIIWSQEYNYMFTCRWAGQEKTAKQTKQTNKQQKKKELIENKQLLKRETEFVHVRAESRWGAAKESLDLTNITLVTARHLHSLSHLGRNKTKIILKL